MPPQGIYFRYKDINRLKLRGRKKIIHVNGNQKRAGMSTLIYKIDFSQKLFQETKMDTID